MLEPILFVYFMYLVGGLTHYPASHKEPASWISASPGLGLEMYTTMPTQPLWLAQHALGNLRDHGTLEPVLL